MALALGFVIALASLLAQDSGPDAAGGGELPTVAAGWSGTDGGLWRADRIFDLRRQE